MTLFRILALAAGILCCAGPSRADYPLALYEGPWSEDAIEWWQDAQNGFRWNTGSMTTVNQFLRTDLRVTRRAGRFRLRYDHGYVSDLIARVAYDPSAPRSSYGVLRVDAPVRAPWFAVGALRMNYYKSYGAGGLGVGRALPGGGDAHLLVLARLMADAVARDEAVEQPARTVRYPAVPFDLYFQARGRPRSDLRVLVEAQYRRTEWTETAERGNPPLAAQRLLHEETQAKLKLWWNGPHGLAARLLAEVRAERFRPLALHRLRYSEDVHFGEGPPYHAALLVRHDAGRLRSEVRMFTGFAQWSSYQYLEERRHARGAGPRVELRFARWGAFSVQGDVERGIGRHPQRAVFSHAEQLLLPLRPDFRGLVEMSYYFQAGKTWNLTRYEITWLF